MKHYFIFGEQACNIYDEYGIKKLSHRIATRSIDAPDSFIFEDGVTNPAVLLNHAMGNERYAELTKEEFVLLFGDNICD